MKKLVEKKMTDELIKKAKELFEKNPMMTCIDVAKTIGVSESTLRKHFGKECHDATQRNLDRNIKKRAD